MGLNHSYKQTFKIGSKYQPFFIINNVLMQSNIKAIVTVMLHIVNLGTHICRFLTGRNRSYCVNLTILKMENLNCYGQVAAQ